MVTIRPQIDGWCGHVTGMEWLLDSPQRLDIAQVQAQETPSRHERIREAIMRLTGRDGQQPNDSNGQSGSSPDPAPSTAKWRSLPLQSLQN